MASMISPVRRETIDFLACRSCGLCAFDCRDFAIHLDRSLGIREQANDFLVVSSLVFPLWLRSFGDSKKKCTSTNIFSPFFPSGCSLNKYGAVIGNSLPAWTFPGGLRFFLTFSLLDVP